MGWGALGVGVSTFSAYLTFSCLIFRNSTRLDGSGRWDGGAGGGRDPGQIGLHESRGISYINTGRAINNMTIRPVLFPSRS